MTALGDWIRANPTAALAYTQAPQFAAFNLGWKRDANDLARVVDALGLQDETQALAFVAALNSAAGTVFPSLVDPSIGVALSDMEAVSYASQIEPIMAGPLIPKAATYWVSPSDATLYLPTVDQLRTIMAACPASRYTWQAEVMDCDDHARILRGWLSEHGLGTAAIGFGGYRVYNNSNVDIGAHALGLAICTDRQPWLAEPRDGCVYPISKVNLGGFWSAHHIGFTLVQF